MRTNTTPKQKVTFSLLAPEALSVKLVGDFSNWEDQPVDLKKLKNGRWKATLALTEGRHEYRYLVDGQWRGVHNGPPLVPDCFWGVKLVCCLASVLGRFILLAVLCVPTFAFLVVCFLVASVFCLLM